MHRAPCVALIFSLMSAWPAPVHAQWSAAVFAGAAHTSPADVTITQQASGTDATFDSVGSRAESWRSPIYYGYRLGYFLGARRRVAIEGEFMHAKVFLNTTETVAARGVSLGQPVAGQVALSSVVQRLDLSHGLNFVFANFVAVRRFGKGDGGAPLLIAARVGAGVTVPHVEATVGGRATDGYQVGGPGGQAAATVLRRIAGPWYALGEYKLTVARESLSIAGGRARATFLTQHGVFGVAWVSSH